MSRKQISTHSERLLAQNSEAALAVIVIWARATIFVFVCQGVQKHILRHPQERILKSYQAIDVLKTTDSEVVPGNIFTSDQGS